MESSKDLGARIFAGLFLALLLVPLLQDLLAGAPASLDDFIGRQPLIAAVNNFKAYALHDRYFNEMVSGAPGWWIYTGERSLDNFQNTDRYTKKELERLHARLDALCATLARHDVRLILLIPPNKNTIYPEYVPAEIPRLNPKSRLDQVAEAWPARDGCRLIDLRRTMAQAKAHDLLYYATDTHWNDMGAYLGYRELTRALQSDFPAVRLRQLTEFEQQSGIYQGDLGQNIGHFQMTEQTTHLIPRFELEFTARTWYEGAVAVHSTQAPDPALPSAIVYHDSFFNDLLPLVGENFRQAAYYWSFVFNLDDLLAQQPDYLILEITERYLNPVLDDIARLQPVK